MYSFILDDFVWSFSRLETYEKCPYNFYLQYIECQKGESGFFAEYGTVVHTTLEKYAKGELLEFELLIDFEKNFDEIVLTTAPNFGNTDLRNSYLEAGKEYFCNFEGFGDIKVLGVEETYNFKIDKYNFTGKIDLATSNSIIDHKTKSKKHITRLSKKHNPENYIKLVDGRYVPFENFVQLYVYSIPYCNTYGKLPEYLELNMVRINDWYRAKYEDVYLEKALKWVYEKLDGIYRTIEFNKGSEVGAMFCNAVCSQRFNCKYSDRYTDMGV